MQGKPREISTTKIILLLLFVTFICFTATMVAVFIKTGSVPDSLIYSFSGTLFSEVFVGGWLRSKDVIKDAERKILLLKKHNIPFTVKDIFPSEVGYYDNNESYVMGNYNGEENNMEGNNV